MSHETYRRAQVEMASPRDAEYQAFSSVTSKLIALSNSDVPDLKDRAQAVHDNKQLWFMLANDCADDRNLLPEETRATIINLSRWVDKYSRAVIRDNESISPLIDINRIMMDGLAGRREPAA